jgi:hypothetical protein
VDTGPMQKTYADGLRAALLSINDYLSGVCSSEELDMLESLRADIEAKLADSEGDVPDEL